MKKDKKRVLKLTSFFLGFSWYMGWVVLGLWLISTIIVPMATYKVEGVASYVNTFPVHFEVPAPAANPNVEIDTGDSPKDISIDYADGFISFTSSKIRFQIITIIGIFLDSAVVLFVIFQLRKIVSLVKAKKPFMRENLARIKKIALAILAYSLLVGLYGFVTSSIVRDEFYINLYMPSINILPMWEFFDSNLILLVLIILVIEESFSIGLKLQKDKDLTI